MAPRVGINLQVKEGEFCSMVGASGCGKSTFLRLLLGQEKPEQQAQKGRFTTAGRADHRAKLALFDLQIDALQHLGQEKPTRGAILLDGQPLAAEPDRSRGVVFQRYSRSIYHSRTRRPSSKTRPL
jgi:NitT/TauT family transport system ATP-binding protein